MSVDSGAFLQFMMSKQFRPYDECFAFCQSLNKDINSEALFKDFISNVNANIKDHGFKVHMATCEVTGDEYVSFLNTEQSFVLINGQYSANDVFYYELLVEEIVSSEEHQLLKNECINMSSSVQNVSISRADELVAKWLHDGYFVSQGNMLCLGPKTIYEFNLPLLEKFNEKIESCLLCKELVIFGASCGACRKMVHNHCLRRHSVVSDKCSNCKERWVSQEFI